MGQAYVKLKWTDPPDINTNEPCPATWAGTVVVRKEGSAPKHRWDGTLIVDSTTRNQYASTALMDDTIEEGKAYYYGIFPYDTKGDYRYTKVVSTDVDYAPEHFVLYDGVFPDGVEYDLGNIRDNSSTLMPVIESDYIRVPAEHSEASTIVFTTRLARCSTLKIRLKKTGEIGTATMHVLGGVDNSGYAKLTPNYDNRSIYNIYSDSIPDAFQQYVPMNDLPFNEETTVSIPLPETSEGLYIGILCGYPVNIYKIWGE